MTTSSTPTLTLTLSVLYRSPIGVVEADQTAAVEAAAEEANKESGKASFFF